MDRYAALLAENPAHAKTRDALFALTEDEELCVRACDILQPILESEDEPPALIDLLQRRQALETEPVRAEMLRRVASLQAERMDDGMAAFETYLEAFNAHPESEDTRDALENLAQVTGHYSRVAEEYRGQLDNLFDSEAHAKLGMRLADMLEKRLEDVPGAIEVLRLVIDQGTDSDAVLSWLERLLRDQDDHVGLVEILERRAQASMDTAVQAALFVQVGERRRARWPTTTRPWWPIEMPWIASRRMAGPGCAVRVAG